MIEFREMREVEVRADALGTITRLEERNAGLWFEVEIADTSTGRDVLALARLDLLLEGGGPTR